MRCFPYRTSKKEISIWKGFRRMVGIPEGYGGRVLQFWVDHNVILEGKCHLRCQSGLTVGVYQGSATGAF